MYTYNKPRNRQQFVREQLTAAVSDNNTVVFRQTHSTDSMRRFNQPHDFNINNLAEKVPIHYRSNKKLISPSAVTGHDHGAEDEDEDPSGLRHPHSANYPPKQALKTAPFLPGDKVIFAESPSAPGVPVVYRTPEERAANPDRLNLDRRKLHVCPILEGEEQLRLLNYQHNQISRIQYLGTLKRLIFLDLYDNNIDEINGLSALRSLRVLMLGKNRIKKIENLDSLSKLDVLDLHGNQISVIENLNHLMELRVLNLAGNNIREVDNLTGMDALAELNLRRNRIRVVMDIDSLPNLQRLFLSFNEISSYEDISCLGETHSLSEISLDGNPISQDQYYKQVILRHMQQLKQLDMKRVTEEERRVALVMGRKSEERKRELNKQAIMKEKRRIAINNAKRQWETMQGPLLQKTSKLVPMSSVHGDLYARHLGTVSNTTEYLVPSSHYRDCDGEDTDSQASEKRGGSRPCSAKSSSTTELSIDSQRERSRSSNRRVDTTRNTNQHKEILLFGQSDNQGGGELSDVAHLDGDTLSLYGPPSLSALDKNWGIQAAGAITVINFKFIDFDNIVKQLPKLRTRYPSVQTLIFSSTNIWSLQQINALASIRRLDNLTIDLDGNPVTKFTLWRMYTIFRLAHFALKKINGIEVSPTDIVNAEKLFGPLSFIVGFKLPQSHVKPILDVRKKTSSCSNEEKPRKALETKQGERIQLELEGRARLTYQPVTGDQAVKPQDHDAKREFPRSYVNELTREAVFSDRKRAELQKIWPQLFFEMVQSAIMDMSDMNAYKKRCMEDLERT
ncbi:leucine-rich repeat-containing protein 49-like isoform X2 [Gigantopelta aegis]|uniref:leucine-rich repeat-containing protein 49-like isoform X2 n=2 Tax=Gigantopelta aegis TaxID=1735272 RepID=UPI001B88C633|nr:leucine-rich repeat-containing protein 49-like isoform X2 [Gigantopelta aegis]